MPYLLDTNVISESVRRQPEPKVLAWIAEQNPSELFLSSMTIGELMRGARKLKDEIRRDKLEKWIEGELVGQFDGRILPFDEPSARRWGRLMGDGDRSGRPAAFADAQIAAVALENNLDLVTRNVKDFDRFDLDIVNPWDHVEKAG